MNKNFLFLMFLAITMLACETESAKVEFPAEITKHKLFGGAVLELPKSFELVETTENLEVRLKETGNGDVFLIDTLSFNFRMNHQLFFDFSSGEKMMYLIVDHAGPRFELNEELIGKYITMTERQTAQKYADQSFKQEKIAHSLTEINGSRFLKLKVKITLNKEVFYRTTYTAMLKENRRSLTFTFDNYNADNVDLEAFIFAFT